MSGDIITPRAYRLVVLWAVALMVFFVLVGSYGIWKLLGYRDQTAQTRKAWLETTTGINPGSTPEAKSEAVRVGIYVNRIVEVDMHALSWAADFDLWFHWMNKGIDPGETFQLANGEIDAREKREAYVDGAWRYERYRIKARIAKYFDPTRFPFANEPLVIQVEDGVHNVNQLNFVADTKGSAVSPTALVNDLIKIDRVVAGVRLHDYGSNRGHAFRGLEKSDVHSQFAFGMLVHPPGLTFYLKMFHVLFTSVAISVLAFFIKPIHVDPRFGLGVGAVFAAIGNMIAVAGILPRAQQATLADMVNVLGLVTIFLTLVQSTISLYLHDTLGLEKLSRFFDRVSFAVFFVGYVLVNIALPLAARL